MINKSPKSEANSNTVKIGLNLSSRHDLIVSLINSLKL